MGELLDFMKDKELETFFLKEQIGFEIANSPIGEFPLFRLLPELEEAIRTKKLSLIHI